MKLGLGRRGLSFGGSGGPPKPVTDFFNGFELSGSTYSGGPTVVADNTGALVTSPANVLPIEGMRLSGNTWLPTTSLGAQIHPSTPLRTRKGTVSVYSEDFKGALVEPPRTNKVACRKANPVDTTNVVKAGDAAAVLSVVDDTAALAAAGLDKICTSGKVYKLDNSAGATNASASLGGAPGNTNKHVFSVYMRSIGAQELRIGISGLSGFEEKLLSATYQRYSTAPITPTDTAVVSYILANGGETVYFILPQLEEGAFVTSPIALASDGSDPLTALTSPAANLTRPTAGSGLESGNDFAIYGRVVPKAAGQDAYIASLYIDASNWFAVYATDSGTNIRLGKVVAGAAQIVNASGGYTHAANTPFEYLAYQHSVHGMGIAVRSWNGSAWSAWSAWATNANTANAPIASTYQIGARNNANHFAANYPFTKIIALNPALNPQSQLADWLSKNRI